MATCGELSTSACTLQSIAAKEFRCMCICKVLLQFIIIIYIINTENRFFDICLTRRIDPWPSDYSNQIPGRIQLRIFVELSMSFFNFPNHADGGGNRDAPRILPVPSGHNPGLSSPRTEYPARCQL